MPGAWWEKLLVSWLVVAVVVAVVVVVAAAAVVAVAVAAVAVAAAVVVAVVVQVTLARGHDLVVAGVGVRYRCVASCCAVE